MNDFALLLLLGFTFILGFTLILSFAPLIGRGNSFYVLLFGIVLVTASEFEYHEKFYSK